MATKAELEAELAELRKKLAEQPRPESSEEEPEAEIEMDDEANGTDTLNLETEIGDLIKELENFPHKQALLLALGVFALGYLVGRSK